jgi:1-acyl-sn-glycerol-3-phosphate acyltransferase
MELTPAPQNRHSLGWYWFQFRLVSAFVFFGSLCLFFLSVWPIALLVFRSPLKRKAHARAWIRFGFRSLLRYLDLTRVASVSFHDKRTDKTAPVRLIVANHVTLLDVVILVAQYPWALSLAKKSMTTHPLLRTIIGNAGFISIDRESADRRMEAFGQITAAIKNGETAIVFPEGTRTKSGILGEFNKGAFKALMMTETNLTPIVIGVSESFLSRGSIFNNSGKKVIYRLTVFDNITTPVPEIPKPRHLAEFRSGVWDFFVRHLNRQYAFPWQRMSNSFLHHDMSIEFTSETAEKTVATCVVNESYPHYRGHFVGFPILPAVSQIDLARVVMGEAKQREFRVRRVRRAKFIAPIFPGERLCLELLWNASAPEVEWRLKGGKSEFSRGILSYEP